MYKCKVNYSITTKNKQNNKNKCTKLNNCCVEIVLSQVSSSSLYSSGSSVTTASSIRIRKKRRARRRNNTFNHCIALPFSGSFWQRHNQNLILTHKTHRLIVIKPYRYIAVV